MSINILWDILERSTLESCLGNTRSIMQLTRYTDYSLRVLIYLNLHDGKTVTIDEIRDFYDISRNHLMKVVHDLSLKGFIETIRGKHGGMKLAKPADQISVGDVVRQMESSFKLVECRTDNQLECRVASICSLKSVLDEALDNFLAHLDRYTLEQATTGGIETLNQQFVQISSISISD